MNDTQLPASEQFCYLTTQGRNSGRPHTIEIWFATPTEGRSLYMLSGGGANSDWVKNLLNNPEVSVRIGGRTCVGRGRVVQDPDEGRLARKLIVAKYYGREEVATEGWEATSLPVAIDLNL
ncbi:MAG: nitroreductase family deazaflavin-dependent oxidoreductase [Chloroflexi bacterium]|nr:nitroreductase family deazaflavin-dependent oxidoreductase [Chloroflexota bacterium]